MTLRKTLATALMTLAGAAAATSSASAATQGEAHMALDAHAKALAQYSQEQGNIWRWYDAGADAQNMWLYNGFWAGKVWVLARPYAEDGNSSRPDTHRYFYILHCIYFTPQNIYCEYKYETLAPEA